MHDMNRVVGRDDLLFVTLDTLRFDVAERLHREGRTPNLSRLLGPAGWERRHSPSSFTYAAHHAFFAGFLPTPVAPGRHPRPFALRFEGSETIREETCVFDAPDLVHGLEGRGYHTICVGGVGFFNRKNPLGRVLPDLFAESHWEPEFGVTNPHGLEAQIDAAIAAIDRLPDTRRAFLFLDVSSLHQPNRFYLDGATEDSLESHAAALEYVDRTLPRLFERLARRGRWLAILCSDHGTAYGEDGYEGHRIGHEVVWTVPYGEVWLGGEPP